MIPTDEWFRYLLSHECPHCGGPVAAAWIYGRKPENPEKASWACEREARIVTPKISVEET